MSARIREIAQTLPWPMCFVYTRPLDSQLVAHSLIWTFPVLESSTWIYLGVDLVNPYRSDDPIFRLLMLFWWANQSALLFSH